MRILMDVVVVGCLLLTSSALAFDLQGHRGARGLAPENTLPAFARALSLGVTTLELDTAITKDGVVVISHDSVVEPGHYARQRREVARKDRARDPFVNLRRVAAV